MYDFLRFAKLVSQYKVNKDPEILTTLEGLVHKYEMCGPDSLGDVELNFGSTHGPNELQSFEDDIEDRLRENEPISSQQVIDTIPKYFIVMEFRQLNQFLAKILINYNSIDIVCWLYIGSLYQAWFEEDDINLGKNISSYYKKIQANKSRIGDATLFNVVEVLNFLNEFKYMNFTSTPVDLQLVEEMGFFQEFSIVTLIINIVSKPFNDIKLSEPIAETLSDNSPHLYRLLESVQSMKHTSFDGVEKELQLITFILPVARTNNFLNYFESIIKFKLFLSLLTFTSKIDFSTISLLINVNVDDKEKFIRLIALLSLNEVGIGYDVLTDTFYNNGSESNSLVSDANVINHRLKAQSYALALKNELVNKITK